jgi:hypothetical protein
MCGSNNTIHANHDIPVWSGYWNYIMICGLHRKWSLHTKIPGSTHEDQSDKQKTTSINIEHTVRQKVPTVCDKWAASVTNDHVNSILVSLFKLFPLIALFPLIKWRTCIVTIDSFSSTGCIPMATFALQPRTPRSYAFAHSSVTQGWIAREFLNWGSIHQTPRIINQVRRLLCLWTF